MEQAIETLTDTCLGPCQENQALLGKQKHLLSFINVIMETDIDFSDQNPYNKQDHQHVNPQEHQLNEDQKKAKKNRELLEVFNITIKLLLSIFQGNKSQEVKASILKHLKMQSIIKKLLEIYREQVKYKKIEDYYQDNLTEQETIVLETGFDLYIFLTTMKEEFPDEESSQNFSIRKLSSQDRSKYKQLCKSLKPAIKSEKKVAQKSRTTSSNKVHPGSSPTKAPATARQLTRNVGYSAPKEYDKKLLLNDDDDDRDSVQELMPNTLKYDDRTIQAQSGKLSESFLIQSPDKSGFKAHYEQYALKHQGTYEEGIRQKQDLELYHRLHDQCHLNKAIKFFKRFVQSVEILNEEEEASKQYFQVPFVCNFVTQNIRYNLIYEANRNSDAERLEHLVFNQEKYLKEMEHRQSLAKYVVLNWFVRNWRMFKDIAFLFVFANNIIILTTFNTADGIGIQTGNMPRWSIIANDILSIIQCLLASVTLLFSTIERYPISIHKSKRQILKSEKASRELKKELAIEQNSASLYSAVVDAIKNYNFGRASESPDADQNPQCLLKSWYVFSDWQNFYNMMYLLFSLLAALLHPLFYSVLLLDLVKRSDDLQNIISSITLNLNQLFKTTLLGAIVMYFYAILGYLYFNEDYPNADNAEVSCMASLFFTDLDRIQRRICTARP